MPSILLLLVAILTSLLNATTLPTAANSDFENYRYLKSFMLTGETLGQGGLLSYYGMLLFLGDDCRLTLYSYAIVHHISDKTIDTTSNCTLTLNNLGQLVIHDIDGTQQWASKRNPHFPKGKYAVVLHPNGPIAIYGPSVWSTSPVKCSSDKHKPLVLHDIRYDLNVFFSDQTPVEGIVIETSINALVMSPDCDLTLFTKSKWLIWSTGTGGMGVNCTVGLNRMGQLTIYEGSDGVIWTSGLPSTEGDYVMILEDNDQAVIYGPVVWRAPVID